MSESERLLDGGPTQRGDASARVDDKTSHAAHAPICASGGANALMQVEGAAARKGETVILDIFVPPGAVGHDLLCLRLHENAPNFLLVAVPMGMPEGSDGTCT